MAFSTFVFDTLDVSTRLGRYIVQELFGWKGKSGALAGTLLTVGLPLLLVVTSDQKAYLEYWTLFGASNQLLAAMTLLVIGVWLKKTGRLSRFTLIPMLFVLVMTTWALVSILIDKATTAAHSLPAAANAITAAMLLALAGFLVLTGFKHVRGAIFQSG